MPEVETDAEFWARRRAEADTAGLPKGRSGDGGAGRRRRAIREYVANNYRDKVGADALDVAAEITAQEGKFGE
jgi:hypothetical protein